ncbi:MAG: DUF309 domain-containing protein [Acidobacteria bacterium]|nr:DUF309 domain-containing protein [Acidobacteriota bacterium]MCA1611957.1 DUF309 domain-containing protein [Acidobacteriota bacterium]MCA1617293.1 DUF309 domain-containing protein [Acidobacteriota bacterium]
MVPASRVSLSRGRALFNDGLFFEAHEVWEEAWLVETGARRRVLQGLIQIAAALLKAGRAEHPRGSLRLLDAGIEKLENGDTAGNGLAFAAFLSSLRQLRPSVVAWAEGRSPAPPPDSFPKLGEEGVP